LGGGFEEEFRKTVGKTLGGPFRGREKEKVETKGIKKKQHKQNWVVSEGGKKKQPNLVQKMEKRKITGAKVPGGGRREKNRKQKKDGRKVVIGKRQLQKDHHQ